ncbi:RHS repeat-associated core domain-containing protein [Luteibacter sp. CQ10]|uniref:RHS repeat-associated core domain-containing protein n=1 Tax=Luteibacter sp. CQ10 TaxID=2805821 RepID=UPI0034A5204B
MRTTMLTYGAYGERDRGTAGSGYGGELNECDTGWYLLGGRVYHPVLRRFLGPDSESPFDRGGMNRYAYCAGDPINRIDPDGASFVKWLGLAVGIVGTIVATVATAGLATAAVASGITPALVATLSVSTVSIVADAGSVVASVAKKNALADILGYVAMGTGLLSIGTGAASSIGKVGKSLTRAAKKGLERTGRKSATSARVRSLPAAGGDIVDGTRRASSEVARKAKGHGGARAPSSSRMPSTPKNDTVATGMREMPEATSRRIRPEPLADTSASASPPASAGRARDDYGLDRSNVAGEVMQAVGYTAYGMYPDAPAVPLPTPAHHGQQDDYADDLLQLDTQWALDRL